MPKIISHGVTFGESVIKEYTKRITQKAYGDLSEEEKRNNVYYITEDDGMDSITNRIGNADFSKIGSTLSEAIVNLNQKIGTGVSGGGSSSSPEDSINILDAYPVGSIYMSVSSTNPSQLFGGTWVSWGAGRFPIGLNSSNTSYSVSEKTGGEATVKLTTNNLPSHSHTVSGHTHTIGDHTHPIPALSGSTSSDGGYHSHYGYSINAIYASSGTSSKRLCSAATSGKEDSTKAITKEDGIHTHGVQTVASTTGKGGGTTGSTAPSTTSVGSDLAHNNIPPYIVCYMWKRTA